MPLSAFAVHTNLQNTNVNIISKLKFDRTRMKNESLDESFPLTRTLVKDESRLILSVKNAPYQLSLKFEHTNYRWL